jgi:hypothetical protein
MFAVDDNKIKPGVGKDFNARRIINLKKGPEYEIAVKQPFLFFPPLKHFRLLMSVIVSTES